MEESICRIVVERDDDKLFLVRVTSDIDGTKEFRHSDLDSLMREVSVDLQLSYKEFTEMDSNYVDPEEMEDFGEEEY